jgi:uncharacterized OB-fold protein
LTDPQTGSKQYTVEKLIGIPPAVTEETRAYWDAAREGRLLAQRCEACQVQSFPPRSICRACRSRDIGLIDVKGPGNIYSYTVNYQRWLPGLEVPFAIALVEFARHPGVRVPGRLRGCAMDAIEIGMSVEIGFEPGPDGFAIPSFVCTELP